MLITLIIYYHLNHSPCVGVRSDLPTRIAVRTFLILVGTARHERNDTYYYYTNSADTVYLATFPIDPSTSPFAPLPSLRHPLTSLTTLFSSSPYSSSSPPPVPTSFETASYSDSHLAPFPSPFLFLFPFPCPSRLCTPPLRVCESPYRALPGRLIRDAAYSERE